MGKLEEKSKKRTKRKNLQLLILDVVSITGVLGVGLLAPNVIGAMGKLGLLPNKRQKEYISSSASKLVKKRLLYYDGKRYCPTSSGEKILRLWKFSNFKFQDCGEWDGKWRVLIFDISEKKRGKRDQMRYYFKKAGLRHLQDSVWIYPYDCEDILTLLKTELGVGKQVLYLIVDELENDKHLRMEFSLI